MFSKFVVEGILLTIFTIIFQYYLMKTIGAANIVDSSYSDHTAITDAQQDLLYSIFQNNAAIFYSSMQITIFLSFTSLCFPIKIILWYLFSYKIKRMFTFITFNNFLIFAFLVYFWQESDTNLNTTERILISQVQILLMELNIMTISLP